MTTELEKAAQRAAELWGHRFPRYWLHGRTHAAAGERAADASFAWTACQSCGALVLIWEGRVYAQTQARCPERGTLAAVPVVLYGVRRRKPGQ